MKTRSTEEMMGLILGFAEADERIRAVVMEGSRINPIITADPFQDYDIVMFVTDVEPFRNAAHVVPHFGEAIVVEVPLAGPWRPGDFDGSYHNYNMQFLDGNRIDLVFSHVDGLVNGQLDSLTAVLLDKDGRVPKLPPPNESSHFITPPTQEVYDGCCSSFYFALGSHIPKTMWRKKLPLLKFYIEGWLRETILLMFSWEIGVRSGWETSIGTKGKYLERHLPVETWDQYQQTFVGADYDELWESLFLLHQIFSRSAQFVASEHGFHFPKDLADKVWAFLEHVRKLPADAEKIY